MTSRDFAFWLQGVFEIGGAKSFDEAQTALICEHLALVFKREIDPSMGDAAHQTALDAIHGPVPAAADKPILTVEEIETLIRKNTPRPSGPVIMRC